jgi:hypothetical protein
MPVNDRCSLFRTRGILIALLIVSCALIAWRVVDYVIDNEFPPGYDARSYIAASLALSEDLSPFDERTWQELEIEPRFSKYLYTPLLAFLILPLLKIPFITLTYIFIALAVCFAGLFIALVNRDLDWRLALIAVLLFPPSWQSVYLGQINFVIAVLLMASIQALQSDREIKLGVVLATATLLKITPLISSLIVFFRGYWKTFIAWALTIVLILLTTLPTVSIRIWLQSSHYALRQVWTFKGMLSWPGLFALHFPRYGEIAGLILVIAMTIYTFIRIRKIPLSLAFTASIFLPLLVARIVWEHHAVMALPAFAVFWNRDRDFRTIAAIAWAGIALIGGVVMPIMLSVCWFVSLWPEACPKVSHWAERVGFFSSRDA